MLVIGLTGGIGMGKSTLAAAFRRAGLPVFDADAEVHRLQAPRGRALPAIARAFPGTVADGVLDRGTLRARVIGDEAAMRRLEAILHPLVHDGRRRFLAAARRAGRRAVVLDIPLLFETGAEAGCDVVAVASAPAAVQRARLRARGRMSAAQAQAIVARQMPDAAKRRLAGLVVPTGLSRFWGQRAVRRALREWRNGLAYPRPARRSPTTPATIASALATRSGPTGSPSSAAPARKPPTVPIPVQTA